MPAELSTIDIVVPCFNPEDGWEDKLIKYFQATQRIIGKEHSTSLVLVNDGSTEGLTPDHIQKIKEACPSMHYISNDPNKGKGHALRVGVGFSEADAIIFTDIDFPYEVESILRIYESLAQGNDIALGYREESYYDKVPPFRKALSKLLRWVLRSILKLSITDTQCGLKGFNQRGKQLFLQTTIKRFLFDLEFVRLASHQKSIKTEPVKVSLRDGVVFSKVNMKVLLVELFNFFTIALFKSKSKSGE